MSEPKKTIHATVLLEHELRAASDAIHHYHDLEKAKAGKKEVANAMADALIAAGRALWDIMPEVANIVILRVPPVDAEVVDVAKEQEKAQ